MNNRKCANDESLLTVNNTLRRKQTKMETFETEKHPGGSVRKPRVKRRERDLKKKLKSRLTNCSGQVAQMITAGPAVTGGEPEWCRESGLRASAESDKVYKQSYFREHDSEVQPDVTHQCSQLCSPVHRAALMNLMVHQQEAGGGQGEGEDDGSDVLRDLLENQMGSQDSERTQHGDRTWTDQDSGSEALRSENKLKQAKATCGEQPNPPKNLETRRVSIEESPTLPSVQCSAWSVPIQMFVDRSHLEQTVQTLIPESILNKLTKSETSKNLGPVLQMITGSETTPKNSSDHRSDLDPRGHADSLSVDDSKIPEDPDTKEQRSGPSGNLKHRSESWTILGSSLHEDPKKVCEEIQDGLANKDQGSTEEPSQLVSGVGNLPVDPQETSCSYISVVKESDSAGPTGSVLDQGLDSLRNQTKQRQTVHGGQSCLAVFVQDVDDTTVRNDQRSKFRRRLEQTADEIKTTILPEFIEGHALQDQLFEEFIGSNANPSSSADVDSCEEVDEQQPLATQQQPQTRVHGVGRPKTELSLESRKHRTDCPTS